MKLRRSVRMSYMYGICCAPVLFGKPLAKNIFSNPFPKKCSVCESQKSGFGLIPRIHPECGFYRFVIRFWIFPKNPPLRVLYRKRLKKRQIHLSTKNSKQTVLKLVVPEGTFLWPIILSTLLLNHETTIKIDKNHALALWKRTISPLL